MNASAEHVSPCSDLSAVGAGGRRANQRKRLRLSCGECRKKKLSCDRKLPCQRCIRSGRPEQCSFESGTRPALATDNSSAQNQAQHNNDQIQELRTEVAHLRALLARDTVVQDSTAESKQTIRLVDGQVDERQTPAQPAQAVNNELWNRSPRGFYRQHTLFQFFVEIPQLFPFIKETAGEWFKPCGISLSKNRPRWDGWRTDAPSLENLMEELLPPRDDTDNLVFFYLNYLEHLHRVVHVPTFKREYAHFWAPERARYPAMTTMVLAIISISVSASPSSADSMSITSKYRPMPPKWISTCDEWLRQQTSKARQLVYYQISCLVYLAKRFNAIRKKRFWNETGSLIQNAIIDGLHHDKGSDTPYMREMKRRIWAVLQELDLQNSFEYGLPSLLHNIDYNFASPANLNDEDFDETSKELPMSKPPSQYTCASYQSLSCRSWKLRLEISRRLFSSGFPKTLSYEDVLRYTHEITQMIDSLPSWDVDEASSKYGPKLPVLSSAFLRFQLQECILAIHRAYIPEGSGGFRLSETVCYHASQDILVLHRKLAELGLQSLTPLREDLLLASLTLTRITLLHTKGSSSVTMAGSGSTVDLLEQCLPLTEDRYLYCFYGEPWCPLTMCGAIMLLKMHLGKESRQTAKSSCAQRFMGLYYKRLRRQETSHRSQKYLPPPSAVSQVTTGTTVQGLPTPGTAAVSTSGWLDSGYSDLDIDSFDLDLDMNWDGAWESPWPTAPA